MMLHTNLCIQPLCILFNKVDGYIGKYDRTKYIPLFNSNEKYNNFFDRIRYLIMLKSNISDVVSHKYTEIKINSIDDLSLEKAITMHNVIMLIKSVFYQNHDHYYYKVFLEKGCINNIGNAIL